MKIMRCFNPECQKDIHYGDSLYVLPYRDHVYCSIECFASHMGVYEVKKDDPESPDEYNAWWDDEEESNEGCSGGIEK